MESRLQGLCVLDNSIDYFQRLGESHQAPDNTKKGDCFHLQREGVMKKWRVGGEFLVA